MTQPSVLPKKAIITQRVALISTIRAWFHYRDEALWAFVGGTEGDKPLEEIAINDETMTPVTEANAACRRAWAIAEKIAKQNEQKASTVMREAINEILAAERPGFLLALDHIPGSF
jgi:hypothetical protein